MQNELDSSSKKLYLACMMKLYFCNES